MKRFRMPLAVVGATVVGLAALGVPTANAEPSGPAEAPRVAIPVSEHSIQNWGDGTNLDEYDGDVVWTRNPSLTWQVWEMTGFSDGTYMIKGLHYGRCLSAEGVGQPVRLRTCSSGNLAQRFYLNQGMNNTMIESRKFRDHVLEGFGEDKPVYLESETGAAQQLWIFYDKTLYDK